MVREELLNACRLIDPYKVASMKEEHRQHKEVTLTLRHAKDKVRLQCRESTIRFSYRIYAILDAADLDYPDEEIRAIVQRYHKYSPFEPFDLHPVELGKSEANLSHQQIVAHLEGIKKTRRLTAEEVRQLNRSKKQVFERAQSAREAAVKATVIGPVLQELIEDRLFFLHQKKILNFLLEQIERLSHQDPKSRAGKGIITERPSLTQNEFNEQYKNVQNTNTQNLKSLRPDAGTFATPQEALSLQN